MKILVINGPNLNMLGIREPQHYGKETYDDLIKKINGYCEGKCEIEIRQSNCEGTLVDFIQSAYFEGFDGIVINPAAYTHTSVGILDALKATAIPAVEVHLSDVKTREDFRQISYAGKACVKTYMGLGFDGYKEAIFYLKEYLKGK